MSRFETTRWSMVLEARGDDAAARLALESLCRAYRPPVLAYIRGRGHRQDAEDLTQAFFTGFIQHASHAAADPARGRFRAFLLASVRHFLSNVAEEARTIKRGGQVQFESIDDADGSGELAMADEHTPERAFEEAWALVVLDAALRRLRDEAVRAGKALLFDGLRRFLTEAPDDDEYAAAAEALGIRRNTLAVSVHRLRQRLRELVRDEVAQTAADDAEVEIELRQLRDVFGSALRTEP